LSDIFHKTDLNNIGSTKFHYFKILSPASSYIIVSTKFDYCKIVPPAPPYIIIPPGGIIIYELTGDNILKQWNVADPIYNNTTWRYYYVWACRRYYFEIMELRGY
jgi:hypothetical protein